ncbi:hypothetical protein KSP39_PZI005673 [Platanthera zijinensis]|uniref:Uncharacterized protein n=1 Tax=Platanthera zijinensis TaxID=2320716 RepID=A0AAP0GB86_9ASPA
MNMMFSSVVATGVHACTPNTTSQTRVSTDERAMSEDDNDPIDNNEHVDSIVASGASESRKRQKKGKNKVTSSVLIDLVECTREIGASLREPPRRTCPFSVAQTLKKLETYPEICCDYDFFDFATMLLMDKNHRETFMCLREEIRVKWLRTRYEKSSQ